MENKPETIADLILKQKIKSVKAENERLRKEIERVQKENTRLIKAESDRFKKEAEQLRKENTRLNVIVKYTAKKRLLENMESDKNSDKAESSKNFDKNESKSEEELPMYSDEDDPYATRQERQLEQMKEMEQLEEMKKETEEPVCKKEKLG